jgi:hypothetical protein
MSTPTLREANDSRQWQNGQWLTKWIITGTSDDGLARLLLDALPTDLIDGITGESLTREEQITDVHAVWVNEDTDEGQWRADVRYHRADEPQKTQRPARIGDVRITGNITGATQHITASLATVHAYGTGAAVGDFGGGASTGGLIAAGKDGPGGCDIDATVMAFQATKTFAGSALPSLGTLWSIRGKTNSASFTVTDSVTGISITLAAGECRLKGLSFSEGRADGGVPFTFEFEASPNRTGLSIGTIGGIACEGWQFLWTAYEPCEIGGRKAPGFKPTAVYVEKVLNSGTFSSLGL